MISPILGNSASLPVFKDGEREFRVSYLTQTKKCEFEFWLRDNARALLYEMKPHLTSDEWRQEYTRYKEDVATGVYGFHSALSIRALQTGEGAITLACILFGASRDEMVDLYTRRGEDLIAFLDEIRSMSSVRNTDEKH